MNNNIITIKKLNKSFSNVHALNSISLNIKKGEKIALIGPSGCGKTTLLNTLMKIEKKDSGNIMILNRNIDEYTSSKEYSKLIGIIHQELYIVKELNVLNNVLAGKLNTWSNIKSFISLFIPFEKENALKALTSVGIENKINEMTYNLSGGEKQRVAIARILLQNPKIILADEPVASLDPKRSEDIISLLCNLTIEFEKTLIASLHSTELAIKYFDRILGMNNGKIIFDLPSDKVSKNQLKQLYSISGADNEIS